jgi:hypothetical protein
VPSEREKRRVEVVAHMQLCIGRGPQADRQGVRAVESGPLGGGMNGVSVVLGTAGNMAFMGSSNDHHVPSWWRCFWRAYWTRLKRQIS